MCPHYLKYIPLNACFLFLKKYHIFSQINDYLRDTIAWISYIFFFAQTILIGQ